MAHFNWLDWILAAIVLISVAAAILKGFVAELISLASVVAGLIVAASSYQRVAPWFEDLARSHEIALGIGFLTLFLGTLLAGAVILALARKLIQKAELQWFDRFLGGIFGLVRGVLVDSILLLALVAFSIKGEVVQQSTLAPYITTGSRLLALAMPDEVKSDFRQSFEKFRRTLAETDKKTVDHH
jgi:membrane protein required for colicin V production